MTATGRRSQVLAACLTAAMVASLAVSGCGAEKAAASSRTESASKSGAETRTPPKKETFTGGIPEGGVFATTSPWRADVRSAPTSGASAAQVANLVRNLQGSYGGVAAFNVYQYNVSWYTVAAEQRTTRVRFSDCQDKGSVPDGLYGPGGQFEDVPIPDKATPTKGTDSALTVYQPSTDTLWDLWKAHHGQRGWHACWGGRIDHVSTSSSQFSGSFGASASGLAYEAGAVSIDDIQSGSIDHAIALGIPAAVVSSVVSWPATRSDGKTEAADAISEGARLRLDPSVDVSSLGLTPIATMIAEAAQKYGFIVADAAGTIGIAAESPSATIEKTGTDPWVELMHGRKSYDVLRDFPWDRLEVLPNDYGKP